MQGIPAVKDTDAEDVVWGLQTAASLWKRGERIDALVWLRRAAQAAGEVNDDARALELGRLAAELSDWLATLPPGAMSEAPPSNPNAQQTFAPGAATYVPGAPSSVPGESIEISIPVEIESQPQPVAHAVFPPPAPRPQPPQSRPPSQPTMRDDPQQEEEHSASVPPAEKVHAGMFNPWDDTTGAQHNAATAKPPVPATTKPPVPKPTMPARSSPPGTFREEEEVITSVRPQAVREGKDTPPPPPPQVPKPPPLPPRAKKPAPPRSVPPSGTKIQAAPSAPAPPPTPVPPPPPTDEDVETSAAQEKPPLFTPPPPSPTQQMAINEQERLRKESLPPGAQDTLEMDAREKRSTDRPAEDDEPPTPAAPEVAVPDFSAPPPPLVVSQPPAAQAALDLEGVEAFADLPDDARAAFAAAATISKLADGEEVSHFALAYVLAGSVDVSATMVDAPAARISKGAVLRSRGTTDEGVPMRLVSASADAEVATWSDAAVEAAFNTCPWVEDDLRAAADRVQTLVGITIGPLGERLDVSIREHIVGQLTMKPLLAGEIVVKEGDVVPGLLLVGVGEIELVQGDAVKGSVSSGDFLFPGEVLGAGNAPATARAGAGGALVLFGDRRIAQELLVTCPPLLEVFAGM